MKQKSKWIILFIFSAVLVVGCSRKLSPYHKAMIEAFQTDSTGVFTDEM